jgi:ubiquinone/menaquinone biosynthesis C-methylase UbiE
MIRLNLGSGDDYKTGFINVDNSPHLKKDLEWDLDSYPYPYQESSVDYIYAYGIIEHIDNLKQFLEEMYRILKPGGKIRFRVPMAFTHADARDPTHKQHINPDTFNKFSKTIGVNRITSARFKPNIWITIPKFHKLKFSRKLYHLNSFITIFTGVEGILTAVK